mmetsp:Transcript_4367/g.10118  ORF Transcript_4367/g.10118 Transcript_4367/m.10118 type:complete len:243 (-) Transcript_4367:227-955(-)
MKLGNCQRRTINVVSVISTNAQRHDRVRSGAVFIHVGFPDCSPLLSLRNAVEDLLTAFHLNLSQAFNVDAPPSFGAVFADLQVVAGVDGQVPYLFIVDLQDTANHGDVPLARGILYFFEQVRTERGNDTPLLGISSPLHGESLARPGLAIREKASVIAFQDLVEQGSCSSIVNFALTRFRAHDAIKSKTIVAVVLPLECHPSFLLKRQALSGSSIFFSFIEWSRTHSHKHGSFFQHVEAASP